MESPPVPEPSLFRFTARLRTRWSDEDLHGVLNNAVYLTLLEEARLAYFGSLDLMEGARFPFVLAQANVRFVAKGRGGAEVVVSVRTSRLGRTSCTQLYRLCEAASGVEWCVAEALLVAVDPRTGEKRPLDERFRERVRAFEGL